MNLQEEWNKMSNEIYLKSPAVPLPDLSKAKLDSGNALLKIKKSLKIKRYWGMGIALAALLATILIDGPARYWMFGMFVAYAVVPNLISGKSNLAARELDVDQVTIQVLKEQLNMIKEVLRVERIWGYIFIPIAGPFGIIFQHVYHGKPLNLLFEDPILICIMALTVIIGIPLIRYSEKMNHIAVGKHVEKLEENIRLLQSE